MTACESAASVGLPSAAVAARLQLGVGLREVVDGQRLLRRLEVDDDGASPVPVAGADGGGPSVDSVYVRPGSGEPVIVTGAESRSTRAQSRFYVSDSGVRYGIAEPQSAAVLGLSAEPAPVPWPIVSLLPPGPTLSRTAALVAHDGVGQG